MGQTRRNFLKLAGAAGLGAAAAPGALKAAQKARTVAARDNPGPKELPRNMTFCTLRRDGRYVLGIRTQRGVLDVEKAAKALKRTAPSTIDEVLQGVEGPYILSDLRYADGPLFVRYGAFVSRYCLSPTGERVLAIEDAHGNLVPDHRGPTFVLPPWIQLPDFLRPHLDARNAVTTNDLAYTIDKLR